MENSKANLFKKMIKVMKEAERVEKNGFNKFQNYSYATENDLIEVLRKSLIENNVFIFTSVDSYELDLSKPTGKDSDTFIATVKTKHTFVDADSGESFEVYSLGSGSDKSDKSIPKAITSCFKYLLTKNFMIQAEQLDPENDGVSPNKPSQKQQSTPQQPKPAPKEQPKQEVKEPAKPTETKSSFGKPATTTPTQKSSFGSKAATTPPPKVETARPDPRSLIPTDADVDLP